MSRILSSPAIPPVFFPPPRERGGGQQNQNQNLFALLSLLNQQQQQGITTEQRQQQLDENIRRTKREEEDREAALLRNDVQLRRIASQKRIEERITKEQNRVFREEISPAYDSSLDKINSSLRLSLKDLISSRDVGDVEGIVRKLNGIVHAEVKKGGAHQYGALTAAADVMSRILRIVPEAAEDQAFQDLELKMSERSFISKIIPRSSFRQLVPTLDEFRLRYDSIRDQGRAAKERVTDITTQVSPTSKADQRRIFGLLREEERFRFDRSPISVEETLDRATSETARPGAPIFSPTLDARSTPPKEDLGLAEGFAKSSQELSAKILAPVENPTAFGEAARGIGALGSLIPSAAVTLGGGVLDALDLNVPITDAGFLSSVFGSDTPFNRRTREIDQGHEDFLRQEGIFGLTLDEITKSRTPGGESPPGFFSLPPGPTGTGASNALGLSGFIDFLFNAAGRDSRQEKERQLGLIAAESDSRTQRGTPPLRIEDGPFPPAPPGGLDFLEQFKREASGLPPLNDQDEVEKLFSSILR